ncbi:MULTISPECIES: rhodanese-like domain-containing protein [unclassified Paenibacillus]|uniref:rhodanese-like domain-containing protein n=1 Tax=unclassified Paenibacillus TaxID=185978 RepID=UPI0036270AF8
METSTIINIIINIVLIIAIVWFISIRCAPIKGVRTLSNKAFGQELQNQKNKMIIDVRDASEYKTGFIPNAINIPLSQLNHKISDIPKDNNVYLYCRSGMRSKQAARILSKQGYTKIADLRGGILAWDGQVK